jgi:Putative prokaryotic signal transducing protein
MTVIQVPPENPCFNYIPPSITSLPVSPRVEFLRPRGTHGTVWPIRMKVVFTSNDAVQVQLFRNVLDSEGIASEMMGVDKHAFVCVAEEDYERAAAIASEFSTSAPHNPWKWRCNCGEDIEEQFEVCWKCGRERGKV